MKTAIILISEAGLHVARTLLAELSASGEFPRFDTDKQVQELQAALAKLPERFRLLTLPGGKYYAARLAPRRDLGRRGIAIDFGGRKVEQLALLLTASRPSNAGDYRGYGYGKKRFIHDPTAALTINYADGTKAAIPLRYRQELTDWNRPFGGFNMRFAVRGVDADKNYYSFGICDVKNPHPEKPIKAIAFGTERLDNISPALLALSLRGADKPFSKSGKPFDPAVLAKREGVGADPEPEFQLRADFEKGMGDVEVSAPKLAAKALKYEIVADPTSPSKSKVLKITLPPGHYSGRAMDEGLIRVSVDLPYRVAPEERAIVADVRVVNSAEDHVRCSIYLLDHDMSYPKNRMYRIYPLADIGAKWRRYCASLEQRGNKTDRLKKLADARFCRVSFFLGNTVHKPVEIYVDNIGCSNSDISSVPLWKEGGEAEPI